MAERGCAIPVARLLKLRDRAAQDNGHEAQSAARRLRELLDRHGLDESALDAMADTEVSVDAAVEPDNSRLAYAIARSRGCGAGTRKSAGLIIRGPRYCATNAAAVYARAVAAVRDYGHPRGLPPVAVQLFQRVFFSTFVDVVIQRLAREAPAPVVTVREVPLRQRDVNAAGTEVADLREALFDSGDLFLAVEVEEDAARCGMRLGAQVGLGVMPTIPKQRVVVRGLLPAMVTR